MERDERSFRVALMADRYVNPGPGGVDGVAAAAQAGWGVLQLPADDYPASLAELLLFEVAEQAQEFAGHGYDLVLVGHRDGLAEALTRVGVGVLDGIEDGDCVQLRDFLQGRPVPRAARE